MRAEEVRVKYKVLYMKPGELRSDDTRYRYPDSATFRDDHEGSERLRLAHEIGLNRMGPDAYGFYSASHQSNPHLGYYVAQPIPENDAEVLSGASFVAPKGSAAPLPDRIPATPAPSSPGENPKAALGALKLPLHLVPPALQVAAARNLGDGAVKYGPYNWRAKKVTTSTYIGAIERHLAMYKDGENVDPESASGASHLGAIAACVAILEDAREHGTLVDDRSKGPAAKTIRRENDGYRRRSAPDPAGGPARDAEEDALIQLLAEARQAAWQVHSGEKQQVTLRPMTRRERRVVHAVIQGHPVLTTKSFGDGDSRRVTVTRANAAGPASSLGYRR